MSKQTGSGDGQISIAIIGAGVASLCLAHGLLKHAHINVCICEARAEIGNDGSGFGIGGNGQNAMQLISPDLLVSLQRAGGVQMVPQVRVMMASGSHAGEHINDVYADPPQKTVRRSTFLTELRKSLPEGLIQTGKRLTVIEDISSHRKVRLTFEDGSAVFADAVVGCDGISSTVRKHISGPDHPSTEAKWTPAFNTRIVIPMSDAVSIFGQEYCNLMTQHGFIGQDGFCLTDIEDDGNAMQVIAGFRGDKPVNEIFGKPFVEVPKTFWTERLKSWGWVGEKICQVIERQNKVFAGSGRYHDATPTYCSGRLCIAGDAARTFSPARGAGAGQSMEDALMLCTVLGCAKGAEEIEKAFKVYDRLRRPRRELVADESQAAGLLITGRDPHLGLDVEKLRKAVDGYNDFIYNYDLDGVVEEAKTSMQRDAT